MNRDDCYILGKITKIQGYQGNVYCFLDTDVPEKYSQMESVLLEIGHELVPFFIEHISIKSNNKALVKFADVDSEADALEMVNKSIYIPLSELPKLDGNKFYFHEILGFKVIDTNGRDLGEVTRVIEYPGNELLEITRGKKETLIPIRDEFLGSLNREEKILNVTLPEGFIDQFTQ